MKKAIDEKALEEARPKEGSTKARILREAENLFARKGFKGTTTREIVNAAGANIALLHYYWGSKEELWNAVHHNLMSQSHDLARELIAELADREPIDAFETLIARLFDFMADNPNVPLLMQQPKGGHDRPWIRDVGAPGFNSLMDYVVAHTGLDFSPIDDKLAVYILVGAVEFFFIRPDLVYLYFKEEMGNYSPEFRERAVRAICTMFERFGQAQAPG